MLEESVRVVEDELTHLLRLVKEFSSFAKMPGLSPSTNEINKLAADVAKLYPRSEVSIETDPDIPAFPFDSDQMRRVFVNLFDNSVSAAGGAKEAVIGIRVKREGERAVVTFTDNGPGIPEDSLPRIFDPYFSTRRGGTGLGLAMVKNIVLLHGGAVDVSSGEGRGAVFTITLPLAGPDEAPGDNRSAPPDNVEPA
jgi:two-component system nitrogen regulation sensor histidine kinase NtrY